MVLPWVSSCSEIGVLARCHYVVLLGNSFLLCPSRTWKAGRRLPAQAAVAAVEARAQPQACASHATWVWIWPKPCTANSWRKSGKLWNLCGSRAENRVQCHAEGGATKGGDKQMRANASKRRQTRTNAEAQTQANASKRGQTQTNAYTPLYCGFLHPPLQSP